MNFEELEVMAYKNEPMPPYQSQAAQLAYQSMRMLYRNYRRQYINKDEATAEKKMIVKAYQEAINKEESRMELYRYVDDIRIHLSPWYKKIESDGCEICKQIIKILDGRQV